MCLLLVLLLTRLHKDVINTNQGRFLDAEHV